MNEEHKKLKEICDKIGYSLTREHNTLRIWVNTNDEIVKQGFIWKEPIKVNVREIIYTQEFMDKLFKYELHRGNFYRKINTCIDMIDNLDNPVGYLYNLLFKND